MLIAAWGMSKSCPFIERATKYVHARTWVQLMEEPLAAFWIWKL